MVSSSVDMEEFEERVENDMDGTYIFSDEYKKFMKNVMGPPVNPLIPPDFSQDSSPSLNNYGIEQSDSSSDGSSVG